MSYQRLSLLIWSPSLAAGNAMRSQLVIHAAEFSADGGSHCRFAVPASKKTALRLLRATNHRALAAIAATIAFAPESLRTARRETLTRQARPTLLATLRRRQQSRAPRQARCRRWRFPQPLLSSHLQRAASEENCEPNSAG